MHYEPLKRRPECLHESIRADCCEHRGGVPGAAVAARRACRRRRLRAQLASARVAHAGFSLVNVHLSIEVMLEAFSFKVSSFCVAMLRRNLNSFSVAKRHVQLQQCISICNLFLFFMRDRIPGSSSRMLLLEVDERFLCPVDTTCSRKE